MVTVEIPVLLWYGNKKLSLDFPSPWDVTSYPMAGDQYQPLIKDNLHDILAHPIGTKPIGALARGCNEVAIVVDDMTRATNPTLVLPYILDELHNCGISNDHIRFIVGLGAHGALNRIELVKKLGEEIVEEFPVWNHNVVGCVDVLGTTTQGTPVEINAEFMACDLKIGIGGIVPHPMTGFGGGSKIIMPGVSSIRTIDYNHVAVLLSGPHRMPHPSLGWGKAEGNILVKDIEEIARMADLDFKVDMVFNGRAQPIGMFAGDVQAEFREGVKLGHTVYATKTPKSADIVVANNYFKSNEASLALTIAEETVKEGGTIVLVAFAPDGQVPHYNCGKWGSNTGGALYNEMARLPAKSKYETLIVFSPYKQKDPPLPIANPEQLLWLKTWKEVLEELKNRHPGTVKVAVYPNAEVQQAI
jgi:nickel-dependent lactate racemase